MHNRLNAFVLSFFLLYTLFHASGQQLSRKLNWTSSKTEGSLKFQDAHYNWAKHHLPIYFEKIALSGASTSYKATLLNTVYETLSDKEIDLITNKSEIPETIHINSQVGYEQKKPQLMVSFIPIRKNPLGGYEKLIAFDVSIVPVAAVTGKKESTQLRTYANSSVLASGTWYKIGVATDGIYKLSYDFIKNLGVDVENIDPKNIQIYGNGGGMLPMANALPRKDDLVENAIFVEGEGDGKFDSADYVLFYGESPDKWLYNAADKKFHHQVHLYSDTTFYFITTDLGQGKRIVTQASSTLPATNTVITFDDYLFHENDLKNLIKSGREWYGEKFDIITSYEIPFSFPNIDATYPVYVKTNLASRCATVSSYNVTCQSVTFPLNSASVTLSDYTGTYATLASGSFTVTPLSSNLSVGVSKNTPSALGWLNYIELNARRQLTMSGQQMAFRDIQSVGTAKVSEFNITGTSANTKVWEVTDPNNVKLQSTTLNGSNLSYTVQTDSLRNFVAFNGNSFYTPVSFGVVPNQNLHGLGQTDMIIITHPNFMDEAKTLANYHTDNDGLSTIVANTQEIFNEFSSGAQDISALRDFVKMFYDRAGSDASLLPKYLLLLGDGSYDNKSKSSNNTNYIPTFQSIESVTVAGSYLSDDFYGALDDNEGNLLSGVDLIDIGIGRIPAKSKDEALAVINKIKKYSSPGASFGDWRNTICFVADDQYSDYPDGNIFVDASDEFAKNIDTTYNDYNVDKIYMDAYPQVSTLGEHRYPDATLAFNQRVEKGALIINYMGHGGEIGLAHERLIELADVNGWKNINKLPLFITATCEFSRFDDPELTSAGERTLLNPDGGGIALLTTTRIAWQNNNETLNRNFFKNAFVPLNGKMPTLGDLTRITKINSGADDALRNFVLLGDPALKLAYPEYNVQTTMVNNNPINISSPDTMKALSVVSVSGYIQDKNGIKLSNYNGILFPTVYDKAQNLKTLSNNMVNNFFPFTLQKNILYKGKVSIINGDFTFSFIVPKDIAYQYGFGRISYYADNSSEDASGSFENIIIGGFSDSTSADNLGPEIKLYMNNEKFVSGGTTNQDPSIYARMKDSTGINTVGNGIGHDITAVLDQNTSKSIVLNDYYEADLNSYKSGIVKYPFSSLSEGKHTLNLKVWDVYNNSSTAYTEFIVAASAELALSHVLNYPNPFTTKTSFYFEHNQAYQLLDVQIQIFTVTGKLVKTINTFVNTDGFRSQPIDWDGKDEYGDAIGKGVYIYQLKVRTSSGSIANKIEKLVVLK